MFKKWYTEWDTRKLIKEAEMIDGCLLLNWVYCAMEETIC